MRKVLFTIILFTSLGVFAQKPDFSCVGFATMNGGTTGGNSAETIIDVSTAAELEAAIGTKKEGGQTPRIIRVNGTIDNGGKEIPIKECSNLTIFGANEDAFIARTPLIITSSSNIIIRNLKFTMTGQGGGKDIIEITTTSSNYCRNIWIDHCEFYNDTPTVAGANSNSIKDKYDGLLDIKKNSEYITISWCYFHDHYKAILVGFTDNDAADRKITMHHNRFERINSRVPSYRGGTAHIYNNYFEGWVEEGVSQGNCIHTREGCNLLVENNYFTKVNKAVYWEPKDAAEGFASGTGNYFAADVKSGFTSAPAVSPFIPPYDEVNQDMAEDIPAITEAFAGIGKISSYDDYGNKSDDNKAPLITITSPTNGTTLEAPANVLVSADVTDEDGTVSKVEIYNGGTLATTLTEAPYSYQFNGLTAGVYSFTVKAYDDKNKFSSRSVSVEVSSPQLSDGGSLFGGTAPADDYFWFGENANTIKELIQDGIISGSAFLNETVKVEYTIQDGACVLPKEGGDIIFTLPSCSKFKLYITRTGSFSGNVFVSTDPENWGTAVASLSGSKGAQEVDYSQAAASATPIYVRIVNTATGGLNIHGANIRLAGGTSINKPYQQDKQIVSTRFYTLTGIQVNRLDNSTIYIREDLLEDGSSIKQKVFYKE